MVEYWISWRGETRSVNVRMCLRSSGGRRRKGKKGGAGLVGESGAVMMLVAVSRARAWRAGSGFRARRMAQLARGGAVERGARISCAVSRVETSQTRWKLRVEGVMCAKM